MKIGSIVIILLGFFCHFSGALANDVTPEERASIQYIVKKCNWSFVGKRDVNGVIYYKFSSQKESVAKTSTKVTAATRKLIIANPGNLQNLANEVALKGPAVIEEAPKDKAFATRYFFDQYERRSAELLARLNTGLKLRQILVPDTGIPIFHFTDKFGKSIRIVNPSAYLSRAKEFGEVKIEVSGLTFTKEIQMQRREIALLNVARLNLKLATIKVGNENFTLLHDPSSNFRVLFKDQLQLADPLFVARVELALNDFKNPNPRNYNNSLLNQITDYTWQVRFYALALEGGEQSWVFTNPNHDLVFVENLRDFFEEIKFFPQDENMIRSCRGVFK